MNVSGWMDPCRTAGLTEVGHKVGKQILLRFLKSWERAADLSRNITQFCLSQPNDVHPSCRCLCDPASVFACIQTLRPDSNVRDFLTISQILTSASPIGRTVFFLSVDVLSLFGIFLRQFRVPLMCGKKREREELLDFHFLKIPITLSLKNVTVTKFTQHPVEIA